MLIDFNNNLNYDIYLISFILFLVLFLIIMGLKIKFDSSYLVIIGSALSCLSSLISAVYFKGEFSVPYLSVLHVTFSSLYLLGIYIPLCVVWSGLSKSFVDGFETTGAGCLMGLYNLGLFANYWLAQVFLNFFDVKPSYLRRLDKVEVSFICVQIFLVGFSFLFVCFKEPFSGVNRDSRL